MLRFLLASCFVVLPLVASEPIPFRAPEGGGKAELPKIACLTPDQHAVIRAALENQRKILREQGKLPAKMEGTRPVLTNPLAINGRVVGDRPWGITNYVDQNGTFPNSLRDYNGGERTYDLESGYNHQGIDYVLWPFAWDMMAKQEVAVVAAAPGTIVFKRDGNPDMNCVWEDGLNWNAVFVEHDDGSTAWYGHLALGSLTTKEVGERVDRGETLGLVGSSGFSSTPHLHFEIYDRDGNLNDPNAGPFNFMNEESWWEDQEAYFNSRVVKMLSHSDVPVTGQCPEEEVPNLKNSFAKGEQARLGVYYRDQLGGHITTYRIIDPNKQVLARWTHGSNAFHYAIGWWFWSFTAEEDQPDGVYIWEAFYQGKVSQHAFAVGDVGSPIFEDFSQSRTAISAGEAVTVTWETSGVLEMHLDNGYGSQKVDGAVVLSPTETTAYTLTAIGPGGVTEMLFDITVKLDASNRFFSHVTPDGAAFATDFILANQTNSDLPYLFQPYDSGGVQLADVDGIVPAGETLHMSKNDLFGNAAVSHFAVQADNNLVVSGAYRAASGGSPAHLTDNAIAATRWRLYTGDWSFVWDGVAVVNRGNAESEIFVTQYDADGNELTSQSLGVLDPDAKRLAVIEALGFQNTPGTHFVIHADQLLAITALRGQLSDALYLWENRAIAE